MKVLLAVPPRPLDQALQILPPLGLGFLAAFLERGGHDVRLVDGLRTQMSDATWRRILASERPGLVGLGAFTTDIPTVERMLRAVREAVPDATTVLGGPHASADPDGSLTRLADLDLVQVGEGERAIVAIADALERGEWPEPEGIPGLTVRDGSGCRGSAPVFDPDLDALGVPDWERLDPLAYQPFPPTLFVKQRPFAPTIVTRGCPYRCTFCAGYKVTGRTMRSRSVEHVLEEIQLLHGRYGIREIHIEDDHFTWDRDFVIRFSQALRDRGPGITWTMPNGVRLETLEREMLTEMKAAGCYQLIVGIESGSPRILKHMRKALTPRLIEEKVALARSVGLKVHGFFMLGYPEETEDDIAATMDLSLRLSLTGANFHSYRPLPGTRSGHELMEQGLIDDWVTDPGAGSFSNAVFSPAALSPGRLKAWQRRMLVRFYLRPRVFLGTVLDALRSGSTTRLARKAATYLT